jgi:hypothetical protein
MLLKFAISVGLGLDASAIFITTSVHGLGSSRKEKNKPIYNTPK